MTYSHLLSLINLYSFHQIFVTKYCNKYYIHNVRMMFTTILMIVTQIEKE